MIVPLWPKFYFAPHSLDFGRGTTVWDDFLGGNNMPSGIYIRTSETLAKIKLNGFKKGHKISNKIRKLISESQTGNKNSRWNNGRTKDSCGYVYVSNKNHPFCNVSGYIAEHRLIMEKHIGRFLNPKEVVHHINKHTNDNRIENLMLFKNSAEHTHHHLAIDGHWHTGLKGRKGKLDYE